MRTLALTLTLLTSACVIAQTKDDLLPLVVNVTANGAGCGQFNVSVYKNNELVAELPPSKYGAFQLDLELNERFSVRVGKPGYRDKTIAVDTEVPEGANTQEPVIYSIDLEPLDRFSHADPFYLDFPCGLIRWNMEADQFDHSERYLADIQLKMALLAAQTIAE